MAARDEMTTYDLHQHLWPDAFVAALRARTRPPRLEQSDLITDEGTFPVDLHDHDPERRLEEIGRHGIDVAVLSLQPSLGLDLLPDEERAELEEAWADSVLTLVAGERRALPRVLPDRRAGGLRRRLAGIVDVRGLRALRARARPRRAAGSPVFVHPDIGGPADPARPAWWEWVNGYPARMQSAYLAWLAIGRERWPTLRVLFAMLGGGGPFQLERLARRGVDVRSASIPTPSSRCRHTAPRDGALHRDLRRRSACLRERHAVVDPRPDTGCRPRFRRCCGPRSPIGHTFPTP
jgi:hypothetical protein